MRSQHQVVTLAAPSNVIAKPASISHFTFFPLDRDVFIESGHALPSGKAFYSRRSSNQRNEANAGEILPTVRIVPSSAGLTKLFDFQFGVIQVRH
jgi:hypothetical protein